MPIDEQTKTALFTGFSNIVRQSGLPGFDGQRMGMAFRMALDSLEPGQPIELQSLFDYLVNEQKAPEPSVLELCIILKSREGKLGVNFTLPVRASYLSQAEVSRMVSTFNARMQGKTGEHSTGGAGAAAAAGQAPIPAREWVPDKTKAPASSTRFYAGVLTVCVVAFIAFYAWRQAIVEAPIEAMSVDNLPGLACTKLQSNGKVAFCDVPKAKVRGLAPESLRAQADLTKAFLKTKGVQTLYVRHAEDGHLILTR